MFDKSFKTAGPIVMSCAILGLSCATAAAGEILFPTDHPAIGMDVPASWHKETTSLGLEMRSPEKNSIVIARVLGREKSFLSAWASQAAATLKTFGVAFDEKASAPPEPSSAATGPATPRPASVSAFTTTPDAFTFSGQPSLATPGTKESNDPVKPGDTSVESLTGFGTTVAPMPKLPFKAVQYFGTTMNGKPVDVQLVIYNLPDQRLFVMMQESGSDDGRAVAIAQSVRGAKEPSK